MLLLELLGWKAIAFLKTVSLRSLLWFRVKLLTLKQLKVLVLCIYIVLIDVDYVYYLQIRRIFIMAELCRIDEVYLFLLFQLFNSVELLRPLQSTLSRL